MADSDFDLSGVDDPEIIAMQKKLKEMEEERERLRKMQEESLTPHVTSISGADNAARPGAGPAGSSAAESLGPGGPEKEEIDSRSVHVGNVHFSSTAEELQAHFQSCGTINRVTILCDKWTGNPKGYAYIEFASPVAVPNALILNDSLFKGRNITITAKRTNIPGLKMRGRGRGRGRGAPRSRGRGMFRGAPRGGFAPY